MLSVEEARRGRRAGRPDCGRVPRLTLWACPRALGRLALAAGGRAEEYVYRERPVARNSPDRGTGRMYLDVEGTSGVVEVLPDGPRPWGGMWWAY